jgi:predicted dienelactone hydrolase
MSRTLGGRLRLIATALSLALALTATGLLAAARPAAAEQVPSALGIPCSSEPAGVQKCTGSIDTRVPSWDGVPLDVDLTLPPAGQQGPHPLIVYLHGWGGSKDGAALDTNGFARQGYAVMAYSARGFGNSCGSEASRAAPGCARG